jgi:uncharacterized delta-60 repeat protein
MGRFSISRPRSLRVVAATALVFLRFALPAFAAAGDLDLAFGIGGKVTTDFSPKQDIANGVAIQTNGKIVVGGASGGGAKFALARYNTDGSLDTTFSGNGMLTTDFTPGVDYANSVAIQVDGRILAAGESGATGHNPKFALAQYNTDGSLDTTFSGDGKLTTDFTRHEDLAHAVAIQDNGKIVAAGTAAADRSNSRFALARYNSDGSLDTTFSGNGMLTTDFTPGADLVFYGLAIQSDGRLVVAGVAGGKFALARYDTNGSLDTSFSGDGKVTTNFTRYGDPAFGVAIQADGKFVAAGEAGFGYPSGEFALARYGAEGSLDPTFGGDGKVTTAFTQLEDGASLPAIQADGKIVAAGGAAFESSNPRFALARYNTDGSLDPTFSTNGKVVTNFTPNADYADGLAIQANGRIIAAGVAGEGGSNPKVALARYLAA